MGTYHVFIHHAENIIKVVHVLQKIMRNFNFAIKYFYKLRVLRTTVAIAKSMKKNQNFK